MKKLLVGYDVLTYNGEMPNCLDSKYLETIHKGRDFVFKFSGEAFQKTWGYPWPVYNGGFWDPYIEKKSIYDIIHNHPNDKWFYLVEPFGNLQVFFGEITPADLHDAYGLSPSGLSGIEDRPVKNSTTPHFLLENISSVALKEIQEGNGHLLINYIIDGGLGVERHNFEKLINFTRSNNIPDEKVYLIFQDFKLADNLKSLNVKYHVFNFNLALRGKSNEFMNTINNPYFSYWGDNGHEPQVGAMGITRNTVGSYTEFEKNIGKEKKDFLFMCRRWKLHRLLVISQLHKLGLEKNLVSWDQRFASEWQQDIEKFLMYDDNKTLIELLSSTSNFVDVQDLVRIAGYGFEDKRPYMNSYINLVGESIFFQNDMEFPSGYLSEKIWKPIGHAQPFILLGPQHSLKHLHDIGYQTFHPFIDESYDNESNGMDRLNKILIEIQKFSAKSKQEKDEFLHNVKDIVRHNHEKFLNYDKTYVEDCEYIINQMLT